MVPPVTTVLLYHLWVLYYYTTSSSSTSRGGTLWSRRVFNGEQTRQKRQEKKQNREREHKTEQTTAQNYSSLFFALKFLFWRIWGAFAFKLNFFRGFHFRGRGALFNGFRGIWPNEEFRMAHTFKTNEYIPRKFCEILFFQEISAKFCFFKTFRNSVTKGRIFFFFFGPRWKRLYSKHSAVLPRCEITTALGKGRNLK